MQLHFSSFYLFIFTEIESFFSLSIKIITPLVLLLV